MAEPKENFELSKPSEKLEENACEDVINSNDDSGITMVDVLEEEQELEEDANAVLGGSDDQNCTYPTGYVKRQALYACGTCSEGSKTAAGICLACSYACHEGHRLFELYTKRNFRCDCGNSKFGGNPCKLFPEKDVLNVDNSYNQNFEGLYCTCARPYPDPEDDFEDEMIQCIACEDWYHGRHIGTAVPPNNEYGELICGKCMDKLDFLSSYAVLSADVCRIAKEDENEQVEVVQISENENIKTEQEKEEEKCNSTGTEVSAPINATEVIGVKEERREGLERSGEKANQCLLKEFMKRGVKRVMGTAVFWPDGWRQRLCRCTSCLEMYVEKKALYLLDDEDTVHSYEEQGKAKNACGQSRYDQGMQALSQMDRVRQVEAIHEYNSMKSELKDFLKNFAESKKVVRKEDIDEFFTQMREQRKRRRVEVSIPHFCR